MCVIFVWTKFLQPTGYYKNKWRKRKHLYLTNWNETHLMGIISFVVFAVGCWWQDLVSNVPNDTTFIFVTIYQRYTLCAVYITIYIYVLLNYYYCYCYYETNGRRSEKNHLYNTFSLSIACISWQRAPTLKPKHQTFGADGTLSPN